MNFIQILLNKLNPPADNFPKLKKEMDDLKLLIAKTLIPHEQSYFSIQGAEFKVFSQWGDDGIIQYLINTLDIENKIFVEFGVENYLEANTRFLLMNDNWKGLVMDGSEANINYIKKDEIYWRHDITAKAAFVTAENINQLLEEENIRGNIGLLHIDIDGNDYWVWKAIKNIDPDIVIVEYNSTFGDDRAITVPYAADFTRTKAHYSNLFYGSSLSSLCDLAEEKDYYFVGCNSAGNNAYFVKKKKIYTLQPLTAKEGFVEAKFRESRNEQGELSFLNGTKKLAALKNLKVINTRTNSIESLSMKILVLGASGFIGHACYNFFSQSNDTLGIDVVTGNESKILTDPDFSVTTKCIQENKPDLIINCAGSANIQQSFSDPTKDHELNTLFVQKILDVLKTHSQRSKLINLSSAAVYGNPKTLPVKETDPTDPLSPYGKHKLLSEELMQTYARSFGLQTLSFRIFSAYGSGLKRQLFYDLSSKFLNDPEKITLHGTGKESRDFIYISDIIKAMDCVSKTNSFDGGVINLANGEESVIETMAHSYAEIFGYKGEITFNGEQFSGYPLNWKADVSKMTALGFQTEISMEKGMELYSDWIKHNFRS